MRLRLSACIRLGRIARKHDCPETAKFIISSMYGHDAMEVQEAFTKIREQAKTFLLQPELLGCGLNLVNTQNLNYFQPHYQAEIFRLKGVFLQVAIGNLDPENIINSIPRIHKSPIIWIEGCRLGMLIQAKVSGKEFFVFQMQWKNARGTVGIPC